MDILKVFIAVLIIVLIIILFKKLKGYNKYCEEIWCTPPKTYEEFENVRMVSYAEPAIGYIAGCSSMGNNDVAIGHKCLPNFSMNSNISLIGTRPGYPMGNPIKCNGM